MRPILLVGSTSFSSMFQVRSPRSRKRHPPKESTNPRLLALSLGSGSNGLHSPANGVGGAPGLAGMGTLEAMMHRSSTFGPPDCFRLSTSPALSSVLLPPQASL